MKPMILLAFAFIFVSCDGADVSSKSQSCYYNDEPVSCDQLNSSSPRGLENEVVLKARVTTEITRDGQYFTTLENTEDVKSEIAEGHDFSCQAFTQAGETLQWKVEGNVLSLKRNGQESRYERISGSGNVLLGKWVANESDKEMDGSVTLEFTQNKLSITNVCIFR